ncbi:ribosomal protein S18 acetylase RimI-like enzyme [Alkaliphilus hydrothermalis]|uniref:Ribosomal protein S18 acetylase RimI-like enzyme n=1 Tax=Alkaliphilus hydrothermalis TaxID=1482730 RepID=A0ABS2NLJ7_9FIRM|nr:GNAT family N-acetyltransferase [Alkaliphilus hydrothermalis]MBM7613761.1 ribosomal protein S18 acetylase RimI-like enzyme [Alkaliphilus hydrothermalis]
MLEELNQWAIDHEISRLGLTVLSSNENAINLYKKMGFKIERTKEKSCLIDGVSVDEYYIGKILA